MQGWLTDSPPPPSRTYIPGEEHKWYWMMGAAKDIPQRERERIEREREAMAGLNRRYAHLHTPKQLTNPAHLVPAVSRGGPTLRIAERYSAGRKIPTKHIQPATRFSLSRPSTGCFILCCRCAARTPPPW